MYLKNLSMVVILSLLLKMTSGFFFHTKKQRKRAHSLYADGVKKERFAEP